MKSSIFAALVGLATAGGSHQGNQVEVNTLSINGGYPAQTTTTYTATSSGASGSAGLSTFLPVASVGGDARLTGVSDLVATSVNGGFALPTAAGGAIGTSSGFSNIGTGPLVVTSTSTGQSSVVAGGTQTGNFPSADLGVIAASQLAGVNNNQVAGSVISNAISNSNSLATLNLNAVFSKLPTGPEVDNLILTGDSVALIKLIQTVGDNTAIPCDQRIAYLLELDGRLKAAIEIKAFGADQLKIVIDTAVAEIDRLQKQINKNNIDIEGLGVDALTNRLNGLLVDLQTAYANYNRIDTQIPVLEAQINGSEKQIQVLLVNSDNERNNVNNNRLKLNQFITQITILQNKLKELQDRRAAVEASIAKGQANVANNDRAILDIRNKIDSLNVQLKDLVDRVQRFDSTVKDLEVKVARIRTDISNADTRKAKLVRDNLALQDRIDIERKKTVPNDATRLNLMIDNLKRSIPNIESEVDRHYYYCFGAGSVQVQNVGGLTVYVVRGDAIANYLRNLYGRNVVVPAVNGDVLFSRVDIFGAPWVGAYGYPFGQASLGGADLAIGGSFGCTAPGSISNGYGTISAVGSNYIEALNQQGLRQRFNLGSCSRLEANTKLPAVGQKFYWSGVPASNGFNLYAGSCFN